jgi:hypothetical protein
VPLAFGFRALPFTRGGVKRKKFVTKKKGALSRAKLKKSGLRRWERHLQCPAVFTGLGGRFFKGKNLARPWFHAGKIPQSEMPLQICSIENNR